MASGRSQQGGGRKLEENIQVDCIYRLGCLDVIQHMGMSVSLRPSLPTWLATKKGAREHKQLSYDCALNMQGTVMVAHACNLSTRQVETRRSKAQGQI